MGINITKEKAIKKIRIMCHIKENVFCDIEDIKHIVSLFQKNKIMKWSYEKIESEMKSIAHVWIAGKDLNEQSDGVICTIYLLLYEGFIHVSKLSLKSIRPFYNHKFKKSK